MPWAWDCAYFRFPSLFPKIMSLALTIEFLATVTQLVEIVGRKNRAASAAMSDCRGFRHAEVRTENWERRQ